MITILEPTPLIAGFVLGCILALFWFLRYRLELSLLATAGIISLAVILAIGLNGGVPS